MTKCRILGLVGFAGLLLGCTGPAPAGPADRWIGTWASAQQLTEPHNLPPAPGLAGQTLRQVVRPTLAGHRLRVTFSNVFGDGPVTLASVQVALSAGDSAIQPASARSLTFNQSPSATIPPGAMIVSDPIFFVVTPSANLAVTVQFATVPPAITGHPGSRMTSFIQAGDAVAAPALPGAKRTDHWYFLSGIEVETDSSAAAIAVLGDSLTDGRGSTTNQNDRWPDRLSHRLQANPTTAHIAVLNQGLGGNRVLRDGLGPAALARFERDVLAHPGVRWLIVLEGINDIGTAVAARAKGEPAATAADLIAAYQEMITRAHARGIRVYGGTIMPFEGFATYYNATSEADRQAVNAWIRTSGAFDGVIDFDAIARDPANPSRLSAAVDGGDHLHLSAAGYKIIAEAIDLSLFAPADPKAAGRR